MDGRGVAMTGSNVTTPIIISSNIDVDNTEFQNFEELARELLSVSKAEIDEAHKNHR
jgi:hypothetical protein